MAREAAPRETPRRAPHASANTAGPGRTAATAAVLAAADAPAPAPRRRHYGIAEIADALGLNRQLVTVWRRRRSWGMPEPDDELASGPLWLGSTIEPWIDTTRARLAGGEPGADAISTHDLRRAGRRLFRLTALLLAEEPRADLVIKAYADLEQITTGVREADQGELRQRLLETLEPVLAAARPPWPDRAAHTHRRLLAACLAAAPGMAGALADAPADVSGTTESGTRARSRRTTLRSSGTRTG